MFTRQHLPALCAAVLVVATGAAADAPNRLDGVISEVNYLGGTTSYRVRLDSGAVVRASMANTARAAEAYGEGQRVTAWFAAEDCVVLEQ